MIKSWIRGVIFLLLLIVDINVIKWLALRAYAFPYITIIQDISFTIMLIAINIFIFDITRRKNVSQENS